MLEIVVKKQLEFYSDSNNIVTKHQSGFKKQHSCETAIQSVVDDWKVLVSEGNLVGVIFMDLKRAFETIDRDRLLDKLYQYGIKGKALEWLRLYLNNRTQQVSVNNIMSKKKFD